MKSYKTLLILGIIVFLVPFLGIPETYKNWATAIIAVILIIYSLKVRYNIITENGLNKKEIFVESKGESRDDIVVREEELPEEVSDEFVDENFGKNEEDK